jgi:hypothetical protein
MRRQSKTEKAFAAMALGLLAGLPGAATAQTAYTFTTVDVPLSPPPNKFSSDTEVNGNSAVGIVGQYQDVGGIVHGFVTSDESKYTTVDVPNSVSTILNGINARGNLTGTYQLSPTNQSPKKVTFNAFFLSNPGALFVGISPPGTVHTQAGNINAMGQVVGAFRSQDQVRHGFIWSSSSNSFIEASFNNPSDGSPNSVPANGGTIPFGINDGTRTTSPQIVGDYVKAPNLGRHGFLLSNGVYTDIDPPGSMMTVAEGINNSGVIVGVYIDTSGGQHGFVLQGGPNGTYTTVDVPGSIKTEINSIDQSNVIVGYYTDKSNNTHGFIGMPNPPTN